MRSRYSAFVLGLTDYLLASWHAGRRPTTLDLEPSRQWLGLRVVRAETAADGNTAVVEFIARSRLPGKRADRLHEVSRFRREQGRWYYVDGDMAAG